MIDPLKTANENALYWRKLALELEDKVAEYSERVNQLGLESLDFQTRMQEFRAENTRLRSALEQIKGLEPEVDGGIQQYAAMSGRMAFMAAEALQSRQETLGALPGESANGAPSTASNPGGMVKGPAARGSSNLAAPPLQSEHDTCYHDGPGAIRRGSEGVRCLMCNEKLEGPEWEWKRTEPDSDHE